MCRYVFRILRSENGETVLTLIGRMSDDNLAELKSLIASERKISRITLDLKDLTLVDREVIHFFGQCEKATITLKNCPAYVRDWTNANRKRKTRRKR